jgi:hypothetical protein
MEIDTPVGKKAPEKDGRKDDSGLYDQSLPTTPNFKGNRSIEPMTGSTSSGLVNNLPLKGQTCNTSSLDKTAACPNAETLIKEMMADQNTDNPDEEKNFDSDAYDKKMYK